MYPWATKEYLLWEMTIGQIILYHNRGIDIKYGTGGSGEEKESGLAGMSLEELRKFRAETLPPEQLAAEDASRAELRRKYGDI